MSYKTYYSIDIEGDCDFFRILSNLKSRCKNAELAFGDYGQGTNELDWDSLEEDMETFSVLYPNLVFIIYGQGEGNENEWRMFFKNGKREIQHSTVTYPDPPGWLKAMTLEEWLRLNYEDIIEQYIACDSSESLNDWLADVYWPVYEEWRDAL
jgi:hypothetical protein